MKHLSDAGGFTLDMKQDLKDNKSQKTNKHGDRIMQTVLHATSLTFTVLCNLSTCSKDSQNTSQLRLNLIKYAC